MSEDINWFNLAKDLARPTSQPIAREVCLHLGCGMGKKLPVRCEGYVEDRRFHVEAVWLDGLPGIGRYLPPGGSSGFDIIENLSHETILWLEDAGTEQIADELSC